MQETGDMELLGRYAGEDSEEAFAALVARHVNLVYSAALRKTGNPHAAEEITQAVFVILAKKAKTLRPETILSGWLYQTARLTAANFLRAQFRRARREQEAFMQSLAPEPEPELWPQIAPLLEDAMGRLDDKDRDALVLRFFEGRSFQEIGAAFGASENAAKKRVAHALEKLRRFFSKRGVVSTTAVVMAAISAHSVHAAPASLAKTVTVVAVAKGATASTSTLTLIKGALKIMAWTKAKTAIVVGAAALLAVGTTTPVVIHVVHQRQAAVSIFSSKTELTDDDNAAYQTQTGTTPAEVARTFFDALSREDWAEAGKFFQPGFDITKGSLKQTYGGIEVLSLGKPFKARIRIAALIALQPNVRNQLKGLGNQSDIPSPGVFVPYEIRLKDGSVKKWQLSIRCDNPEHRWYFDGGM